MTAAIVTARGLTVHRDGMPALVGVDLDVAEGEAVGLVGANGAGKTTLVSTIAGLLPLSGGSLTVLDRRMPSRSSLRQARSLAGAGVALVPDDRALFPTLTARQHLRLALPRRDRHRIDEVVGLLPLLADVLDRPAGLLSGGEQQALALARALCRRPHLLLIDEMSAGLAPLVVDQLTNALRAARCTDGTATIVIDQQVDRVVDIADRLVVLEQGRVAQSGAAHAVDLASFRRAGSGMRPE